MYKILYSKRLKARLPRLCGKGNGTGEMVLAMAHVGRATDQINAELIRLADLLKARESVHAEVAALGGEVEPEGIGGKHLGHGNSGAEAAN